MTDLYPTGLAKIKRYSDAYPDKPLVIMPSSFDFENTDFAGLFQGRTAPAYVFAREKYSYDIVANTEYPSEVHCYLAEDLAFQLAGSEFIQDLQGKCSDDLILLVERCDVEGKRRFMGGGPGQETLDQGHTDLAEIPRQEISSRPESQGTSENDPVRERGPSDYPGKA